MNVLFPLIPRRHIATWRWLRQIRQSITLFFLLVLFPAMAMAQSGSPFDTGFTALQNLFTGTIAKVASLIAIVIGGYQFAHGEPGAELHTSHLGFFHGTARRASSRAALSANYLADETPYGKRWIFQDVHAGGAAAIAGIEPGIILLRVDDREIVPPEHPVFPMGKQIAVEFVTKYDEKKTVSVDVARPTGKKLHFIEPTLVEAKRLGGWASALRRSEAGAAARSARRSSN